MITWQTTPLAKNPHALQIAFLAPVETPVKLTTQSGLGLVMCIAKSYMRKDFDGDMEKRES